MIVCFFFQLFFFFIDNGATTNTVYAIAVRPITNEMWIGGDFGAVTNVRFFFGFLVFNFFKISTFILFHFLSIFRVLT